MARQVRPVVLSAIGLIAIASAAVFLGSSQSWAGPLGSLLMLIVGFVTLMLVAMLAYIPHQVRRTARERSLRSANPEAGLTSIMMGTLGRRFLATLPRLDGRSGEFIPWYFTAVLTAAGMDLYAGGARPRLTYRIPARAIRSITPGVHMDGGKAYRGLTLTVSDKTGGLAVVTLSPLPENMLRRISLAELDAVKQQMQREMSLDL